MLCASPGGEQGTLALPEHEGAHAPPESGAGDTGTLANGSEAAGHRWKLQHVPCPRASGYPELGVGTDAPAAPKRDPGPRKGPDRWM